MDGYLHTSVDGPSVNRLELRSIPQDVCTCDVTFFELSMTLLLKNLTLHVSRHLMPVCVLRSCAVLAEVPLCRHVMLHLRQAITSARSGRNRSSKPAAHEAYVNVISCPLPSSLCNRVHDHVAHEQCLCDFDDASRGERSVDTSKNFG